MNKKRGFTLIEILAVIIVLAVVALIVTPIIINMIGTGRRGAAKSSALGYIKAVENYITSNIVNRGPHLNGVYTVSELEDLITYKGNVPSNGYVNVLNNSIVNSVLCVNNYKVEYTTNGAKILEESCDTIHSNNITERVVNINTHEQKLVGLKINGNTVGGTKLGSDGVIDLVISGKNIILKKGYSTPNNDATFWGSTSYSTPLIDGWRRVSYNNTGSNTVWPFFSIKRTGFVPLLSNSDYTYYIEMRNVTSTGTPGKIIIESDVSNVAYGLFGDNIGSNSVITLNDLKTKSKMIFNLHSVSNLDAATFQGIRSYYEGWVNSSMTYEFRAMLVYGNYNESNIGAYEPYKEKRYHIELRDKNDNVINGLGAGEAIEKRNGTWFVTNGGTSTQLSNETNKILNSITLYEGVSNIFIDEPIQSGNLEVNYY